MPDVDISDAADAARFRWLLEAGFERLVEVVMQTPPSHLREQIDKLRNNGQMML